MYFFIQFFLIRPSVSSYLVLVNSSIPSQSRNVLFSWWVTAMKDIYQRNRRLRMVGVIWHQDLRLTDISIIIYNGCCTTALITGFIISLSSNFHLFPILSIGKDHPEFIWSTCAANSMTLCSFVPCTRGIGVLWLPVIYYLSSGSHPNSVTSHCSVSATLHWQFCVSTSSGFIASDSTAVKSCYDCICLQHWYWLRVEILVDIGNTGTKNVVNHWQDPQITIGDVVEVPHRSLNPSPLSYFYYR